MFNKFKVGDVVKWTDEACKENRFMFEVAGLHRGPYKVKFTRIIEGGEQLIDVEELTMSINACHLEKVLQ